MKKIKLVFIDFQNGSHDQSNVLDEEKKTKYATFTDYQFDSGITSRVGQKFGWTTDLIDSTLIPDYEVSIHVIFIDYLREYGITQLFKSRHGRQYDDVYSYIEGMNLLAFEGYTRAYTIFIIKSIINLIQYSPIDVPVDKPIIQILTSRNNMDIPWIKRLKSQPNTVGVSDDLFLREINIERFIDYSLSRNYQHKLKVYIHSLEAILAII